ncbi:MAG: PHP domain-containing protein [Legionellaceae bacterium]
MIDLHCHSFFSDGCLSPQALLLKALEHQVQVLALTDHDTLEGVASLQAAAAGTSVHIIPGIELSACFKLIDVHILGFNMTIDDPTFISLIKRQEHSRVVRAQKIGEKLLALGLVDAYQKAVQLAGHDRVGRPHFAQVLINEGRAIDMKQAFKRFLGRGRPAYVPTAWISVEEAVRGIVQAKGCAVIAHPFKYALTRTKLHALINAFKLAGGTGLEVVSGRMEPALVAEAAQLCKRFDLLASTGSDYHGDGMSHVGLGRQSALPDDCVPLWSDWGLNL